MSRTRIIIISVAALLLVIGVVLFGFRSGLDSKYTNDEYGFSFSYPSGWKVEQKDVFNSEQISFTDGGEVVLTVMLPYNIVESEVHAVTQTEVFPTNDKQTTLFFQEMEPLHEGWYRIAAVDWHKGCDHNGDRSCFVSGGSGGALVMNMGIDLRIVRKRLAIFKDIINSFKLISD